MGAYTVIIEWDGGRPPTTWYNRLRKLGLSVRGDKAMSPNKRRQGLHGVIQQEGAIVVSSESEARLLGLLAHEMGAQDVIIGAMEFLDLSMTPEDEAVLEHVQQTLGGRGRPTKDADEIFWAVTCLDEMTTSVIQARTIVNCPKCGSFHIHARRGGLRSVPPMRNGESTFDYWLNTRFISGDWELPIVEDDAKTPEPCKIEKLAGYIQLPLVLVESVTEWLPVIDVKVLDAAFYVASLRQETRQRERIRVMYNYITRTGKTPDASLVCDPSKLDMYDIAIFDHKILG